MKIAITTKDGKNVDQHFGKATSFSIYEMNADKLTLLETRGVESYCRQENGAAVNPDHKFSEDRFGHVYEQIKDCSVLYTKQIGAMPEKVLKTKGIKIQSCNCSIDQIPGCRGKCK